MPVTCIGCGACCWWPVALRPGDDVPQDLVDATSRWPSMRRRADGSCAALDRETGTCTIYDRRPATCRQFEVGGRLCRLAKDRRAQ